MLRLNLYTMLIHEIRAFELQIEMNFQFKTPTVINATLRSIKNNYYSYAQVKLKKENKPKIQRLIACNILIIVPGILLLKYFQQMITAKI